MSDTLRIEIQAQPDDDLMNPADWPPRPLKCETESPDTDWPRSWRLARLRGLDPDLTSFIMKLL